MFLISENLSDDIFKIQEFLDHGSKEGFLVKPQKPEFAWNVICIQSLSLIFLKKTKHFELAWNGSGSNWENHWVYKMQIKHFMIYLVAKEIRKCCMEARYI